MILITGASGGVGSGAVQLARLREARVLALAGSRKEQAVRELGADLVVASRSTNLAEHVLAANGGPVDVVADVVGGSIFAGLLRVLRPLGRYVTVGAVGGPVADLDLRTLYLKHLDLLGSTLGSHDDFTRLVRLINEGRLRPALGGTFPLDRIHDAQEAFRRKDFVGNLVITPR
jgi:NADPH:quinone reductase-like Zn-dependent oxidoreductase